MFKLHTKKYKFENEDDVMLTDIFSFVKKLQKIWILILHVKFLQECFQKKNN